MLRKSRKQTQSSSLPIQPGKSHYHKNISVNAPSANRPTVGRSLHKYQNKLIYIFQKAEKQYQHDILSNHKDNMKKVPPGTDQVW